MLSTNPDLPTREPLPLVEPTEDDLAYDIARMKRVGAAFALQNGYDPDMVLHEMREIFTAVQGRLPQTLRDAGVFDEGVVRAGLHVRSLASSLR